MLFFLILSAQGASNDSGNAVVLVGSGSRIPTPLFNRWIKEYGKSSPSVQMRYLTVGTAEGINQLTHGVGDFAAGEAQLTDKVRNESDLIELPMMLIAIVPIYNLPSVHQHLRLSGEVLAEIFLGDLKMWNAPEIAKLNHEIALPNLPIRVITRTSGKGSSYVFTEFLSKASAKFRAQVGVSASPKWPVGTAVERGSDAADKVKNTPGAIGFLEFQNAVASTISQAEVLNAAGKFVKASAASIAAACQAVEAPRWNNFSASLSNAPGADSFPITSFSWIYLRTKSPDDARAAAMAGLLKWMYSEGQQYVPQEGFAVLPTPLLEAVRSKVRELR
jgi:phosphate transport system substrate-binding protein